MSNDLDNPNNGLTPEFDQVCQTAIGYIEKARQKVLKAVNHQQIIAYWKIGRLIVETEQKGSDRANYGAYLIDSLSAQLNQAFEKGFSATNLRYMRQFYQIYKDRIRHTPCDELEVTDFDVNLGWSHYRTLTAETREEVRKFYEIEAAKNHWSVSQLKRQMHSFLYERLAASRDEAGVFAIS